MVGVILEVRYHYRNGVIIMTKINVSIHYHYVYYNYKSSLSLPWMASYMPRKQPNIPAVSCRSFIHLLEWNIKSYCNVKKNNDHYHWIIAMPASRHDSHHALTVKVFLSSIFHSNKCNLQFSLSVHKFKIDNFQYHCHCVMNTHFVIIIMTQTLI